MAKTPADPVVNEAAAPDKKTPALQIVSRRDGFYRCNRPHSASPTIHPAGTFTPEQVEELKNEPVLIVTEIAEPAPDIEPAPAAAT